MPKGHAHPRVLSHRLTPNSQTMPKALGSLRGKDASGEAAREKVAPEVFCLQVPKRCRSLPLLLMRTGWESRGCAARGRAGAGETWEQLPGPGGARKKDGDRLFIGDCCHRTRGCGFKLKKGRFQLDIRQTFVTKRVARHWLRLPREVGDAPSLEAFQARLDGALSKLVWLKMSLLAAGGLDYTTFKGPLQPKLF